jgi:hypothetical protein
LGEHEAEEREGGERDRQRECVTAGVPAGDIRRMGESSHAFSTRRCGGFFRAAATRLGAMDLVDRLARARIGSTHNQYVSSPLRRARLRAYLDEREHVSTILVGEAAGYRGARVSGIAFTSERQLTGAGPAEASATIVHRVLAELGAEDDLLLWNVVPTHPGTATSNRPPTRVEVEAARAFLEELTNGRRVVAVGRLAAAVLDAPYVRHPSHGGAVAFAEGLRRRLAG